MKQIIPQVRFVGNRSCDELSIRNEKRSTGILMTSRSRTDFQQSRGGEILIDYVAAQTFHLDSISNGEKVRSGNMKESNEIDECFLECNDHRDGENGGRGGKHPQLSKPDGCQAGQHNENKPIPCRYHPATAPGDINLFASQDGPHDDSLQQKERENEKDGRDT